jgi:hypothetical protein
VVLDVTAKTDKGTVVNMGKKEYWEIGLDAEGDHRLGAWQIKDIIDLTLPPRKTTKETFVTELPADTKSAEVEIKVTYFPAPGKPIEVHKVVKKLIFEK